MDSSKNGMYKSRYLLYAFPAVIIFAIIYIIRGPVFEDDAFIYYRYAVNWAAGYGPVFNINEYVEGNTSFLWSAVLAIGSFFSFDVVKFAPLINLFIGIICLFLISHISSFITFSKPRLMAIALPLFCSLSYGFYYYGASGMDTLLFSLVLLICIINLYKSKSTGAYLLALISLVVMNITRAEGPLYSIVMLAVLTYFVFIEHKNLPRKLFTTIAIFLGLTLLLFVVRYSIYGVWLPAPVLAKGYASYLIKTALLKGDFESIKEFIRVILSGIKYEEFLFYVGAWIPFIVLVWGKNKNNALLWLIASAILANIFVSVWAGGDYMPYKRHFIAALPLLTIFMAWAIDLLLVRHWNGLYRKGVLSFAVILILFQWYGFFISPPAAEKNFFWGSKRTELIRQLGTLLHDIPDSTVLLTNTLGEISYYAGSRVYVRSVFGLTDIHNAKYGEAWGFIWGEGSCGRTDINYIFSTPYDIYFNNSPHLHKVYISYCQKNPSLCEKYRFFKNEKWPKTFFYVIANINHPVSKILEEKFDAVPVPIDENLKNIS